MRDWWRAHLRELRSRHWRPSLISLYLGGSFLRIWFMALLGFLVLYTAIDFLEKIDDFMEKGLPLATAALFFAAQVPKIVVLMTPVATLIAVLITLALLSRASEIVAFKAGGVSLYRLSWPLMVVSLFICLVMFFISNFLAPGATAAANAIWDGQVRGRVQDSGPVRDVWLKDLRLIQHLAAYDEASGEATGLTLVFVDDNMNLSRRLEAERGHFIDNQLQLYQVAEKIYSSDGEGRRSMRLQRHDSYVLDRWPPPPPGFGQTLQDSDEMSVAQLWRSIDRLRAEGFSPTNQRVDLQFKFSFALLPLIMVVVGLPLGFWKEKGGSVTLGLALGLALSFVYLIAMELARSLGYSGFLPPLMAAWLPNLLFFLFGAYLFSYVRQ